MTDCDHCGCYDELLDKYQRALEFIKFISVNPPCMTRSFKAQKLLKELGESE